MHSMKKIRISIVKIFSLCILCLALFGAYLFHQVFAQQSNAFNLTLTPASMDLAASPGTKLYEKFRIRNDATSPMDLQISVEKLSVTQNGQVTPEKPQPGDDSTTWFAFSKTDLSAPAQEWSDIGFTLSIPPDAAFGYYFVIDITRVDTQIEVNNNAKVLGNVALPILLEVKRSGALKQADIESFATKQFINEYLPIEFDTTIKDTGNVHVKPHGNIFITAGGTQVAALEVNPEVGAVLPGENRTFISSWDNGFFTQDPVIENGTVKADKQGSPVTQFHINWNKFTQFRFGEYTAHIIMAYDNGTRDVTLEKTTTFWVIPYKLIGGGLLVIIILIIIIRYSLKLYVRRQIRKYSKAEEK